MQTMTTDRETEIQIADEAGHDLGCLEWGLEELLEAGTDGGEAYAMWIEGIENGKVKCHCPVEYDGEE